ncbi:hypothetical protein B0H63DRAFT_467373 [Podospora didyma]|uniref:Uncharacterized protein n=1 Tax=Podospora didyma TaxID=330526 RepID=A0AAE0P0Q1_9PEZI|nr:hypothetical protein B0H63DRAFT_467373 [Podospora didyma]
MRSAILSLGALALGLVQAHEYPNCESDGCYRNLIDERFAAEAVSWCPEFLASTTTEASAIPTDFNNCDGNIKAVSSACSCITYTATHTSTPVVSSTSVPESSTPPPASSTPASSTPEVSSTSAPVASSSTPAASSSEIVSSKAPVSSTTNPGSSIPPASSTGYTGPWTTSTILSTTTYTVTKCPVTVTNCPAHSTTVTTEIITIGTTVCPVSVPVSSTLTKYSSLYSSVGTVTAPPKTSSTSTSSVPVTAGAGRIAHGVEMAAAAAGIFAALL